MEYTNNNPLRVVTLCSGYDSQCMALERLKRDCPGFDYDLIAWAEIDRYAIRAHDAVFPQYRDRNMGDITSCDWSKITQPVDLLVYSTPCTSISVAGKQEGLKKDSGTASSIIWSVLNAIDTLKPRYLLMENVKALVSKKFMPDFREWYNELASRGYQNFWKVLNAKDFGVPQNRERVFMVSMLDEDASFHFPEPFPLERRLKDILEEDVEERYYLSDRMVKGFMGHNSRHLEKGTGFLCRPKTKEDIANALRANGAVCPTDNLIYAPIVYDDYNSRVAEDQSVMGTVTPNCGNSAPRNGYKIIEPRIAASQGRNPENPSDRTAGCPTEQRLEIGGDISNTVTTVEKDCLVVMPICLNPKVAGKQPSLEHRVYDCSGNATAITTGFMPSIAVPGILTPKRNGYGKAVRKKYEAGELDESRHNMTYLVPRTDGLSNTITSIAKDNLLIESGVIQVGNISNRTGFDNPMEGRIYSDEGCSPTIKAQANSLIPKIIQRPRGNNAGGLYEVCPTISSSGFEHNASIVEICNVNPSGNGMNGRVISDEGIAPTVSTNKGEGMKILPSEAGFRVRKLTEREVFRLMDVSDGDIDRIQAAGISKSQQYKMAGNSIVTNVLFHIFRKMFIDRDPEDGQLSLF